MNLRNSVILLDDNFTTVKVRYGDNTKVYTYACAKEVANTLKPGDLAIVDNFRGPQIVNVESVDVESDLDMAENSNRIRFILCRVPMELTERLEIQFEEKVRVLNRQKRLAAKQQLRQALDAYVSETNLLAEAKVQDNEFPEADFEDDDDDLF